MTKSSEYMNQKQTVWAAVIITVTASVLGAGIVGATAQVISTRDKALENAQLLEANALEKATYITEFETMKVQMIELQRKQSVYDLEMSYNKQDRERNNDLIEKNLALLTKVDTTLATVEVRMNAEIDALKKSDEELQKRLDKAGL